MPNLALLVMIQMIWQAFRKNVFRFSLGYPCPVGMLYEQIKTFLYIHRMTILLSYVQYFESYVTHKEIGRLFC